MVNCNHPPDPGAKDKPGGEEGGEAGEESVDPPPPSYYPNDHIFKYSTYHIWNVPIKLSNVYIIT